MTADPAALACVVLAHGDPTQLRRLIAALDPFPVFLHVDARTSAETFAAMTDRLPARVTVLDRRATGWAKWENVEAELDGYRVALATTGARHLALFTGTDYPLASSEEITATLRRLEGVSVSELSPLPYPAWGRDAGFSRFRYRHWVWRKHMLRLPVPRRLPGNVVLAGGSQLKVLCRAHALAVVEATDAHPELVRFWRRSWIADETFVSSMLSTFVPGFRDSHLRASLWWIGWDGTPRKSPPWLTLANADAVLSRRLPTEQALETLFARKFSTAESSPLLDLIDARRAVAAWSEQ